MGVVCKAGSKGPFLPLKGDQEFNTQMDFKIICCQIIDKQSDK